MGAKGPGKCQIHMGVWCDPRHPGVGFKHCSQHCIDEEKLNQIILKEIRFLAKLALKDEELVIKRLNNVYEADKEKEQEELAKQIAKDEERIAALEKIMLKLYEDMIAERISENNFNTMMNKTQREQEDLKLRVEEAKQAIGDTPMRSYDTRAWLNMIREYENVTELDREMLNRLIKVIYVHEEVDPNIIRSRERKRTIEIHFNLKPMSKIEKEFPKVYTWGRNEKPKTKKKA